LGCLLLSSDGIDSFYDSTGNQPCLNTIIKNIFEFKLTRGAFLKRRARRQVKELSRLGFAHGDDLGLAALLRNGFTHTGENVC